MIYGGLAYGGYSGISFGYTPSSETTGSYVVNPEAAASTYQTNPEAAAGSYVVGSSESTGSYTSGTESSGSYVVASE